MVLRLTRYISESGQLYSIDDLSVEDIASQLQKECGQIIQEYSSVQGFLLRGIKNINRDKILAVKLGRGGVERQPRDTALHVHDWLNDEFESRFGWRVRNGISTTSSWSTASGYGGGNVYVFFPANGYKFCWSPAIQDLTLSLPSDIRNTRNTDTLAINLEPGRPWAAIMKNDYFDTYQDVNLRKAISSGNEVMFNASKYFLLAVHSGQNFRAILDILFPNQGWANSDFQLNQWTRS